MFNRFFIPLCLRPSTFPNSLPFAFFINIAKSVLTALILTFYPSRSIPAKLKGDSVNAVFQDGRPHIAVSLSKPTTGYRNELPAEYLIRYQVSRIQHAQSRPVPRKLPHKRKGDLYEYNTAYQKRGAAKAVQRFLSDGETQRPKLHPDHHGPEFCAADLRHPGPHLRRCL